LFEENFKSQEFCFQDSIFLKSASFVVVLLFPEISSLFSIVPCDLLEIAF